MEIRHTPLLPSSPQQQSTSPSTTFMADVDSSPRPSSRRQPQQQQKHSITQKSSMVHHSPLPSRNMGAMLANLEQLALSLSDDRKDPCEGPTQTDKATSDRSQPLLLWTISKPVLLVQPQSQPHGSQGLSSYSSKQHDEALDGECSLGYECTLYNSSWVDEASALKEFMSRCRGGQLNRDPLQHVVVLFCIGESVKLKVRKEVSGEVTVVVCTTDHLSTTANLKLYTVVF